MAVANGRSQLSGMFEGSVGRSDCYVMVENAIGETQQQNHHHNLMAMLLQAAAVVVVILLQRYRPRRIHRNRVGVIIEDLHRRYINRVARHSLGVGKYIDWLRRWWL